MRTIRFTYLPVGRASVLAAGIAMSLAAWGAGVDLSPAPLDISASVDPNLLVSIDDSGSMAWNFQGDLPPGVVAADNIDWSKGPWHCAGVIDPTASNTDPRSRVMNGVYYNPKVTYRPPLFKDGTPFP